MSQIHARPPTPRPAFFAALLAVCGLLFGPASLADDVTDIGYVDQAKLASIKPFADANKDLGAYKASLDRQFLQQMRGVKDPSRQQRIAVEFQNRLLAKQRELMGPLFARAQIAIASVASSHSLSVVVDKQIIIVGGRDITQDVVDLLTGVGEPVPPVNTPPPSSVGYVDQTQIDAVPKLKAANDEFAKFQADQQRQAQAKMRTAKSGADRQQVYVAMQKALGDKRHQLIDPLVDETRNVIANVAKKRDLVLVIDKINRIYGGTDITADVTNALK